MATPRHDAAPSSIDELLAHTARAASEAVRLLPRRPHRGAPGACRALAVQTAAAAVVLDGVVLAAAFEGARGEAIVALRGMRRWAEAASDDGEDRAMTADELAVHAEAVTQARDALRASAAQAPAP